MARDQRLHFKLKTLLERFHANLFASNDSSHIPIALRPSHRLAYLNIINDWSPVNWMITRLVIRANMGSESCVDLLAGTDHSQPAMTVLGAELGRTWGGWRGCDCYGAIPLNQLDVTICCCWGSMIGNKTARRLFHYRISNPSHKNRSNS